MAKAKTKIEPLQITSADQLTKLMAAPVVARFKVDTQEIALPCRRITPGEEERLKQIERSARPQRVPNKAVPGGFEYDTTSAEYVERASKAKRTARALAVYMGCPAVSALNPGKVDPAEILTFVEGLWNDWVIEIVAQTIRAGGIGLPAEETEVNDLANFITPPDSGLS